MQPLSNRLKIKLLALSLVFPVSFSFIGFLMGSYFYNTAAATIFGLLGLFIGALLDFVCYYRKLFSLTLYQAPIPLTLFLLVWWISNTFVNDLYAFIFALVGLLIGLWLNSELILPFQFYKIRKRVLGILYLFFAVVILGIFRFIPIFNILLGLLAGNYLSIRVISNFREEREITKNLKQGAAFTSIIQFIITLMAILIAISDIENSMILAQEILPFILNKWVFIILISVGGLFFVVLQYFVTYFSARTMLQLWKHRRFSRYAHD